MEYARLKFNIIENMVKINDKLTCMYHIEKKVESFLLICFKYILKGSRYGNWDLPLTYMPIYLENKFRRLGVFPFNLG